MAKKARHLHILRKSQVFDSFHKICTISFHSASKLACVKNVGHAEAVLQALHIFKKLPALLSACIAPMTKLNQHQKESKVIFFEGLSISCEGCMHRTKHCRCDANMMPLLNSRVSNLCNALMNYGLRGKDSTVYMISTFSMEILLKEYWSSSDKIQTSWAFPEKYHSPGLGVPWDFTDKSTTWWSNSNAPQQKEKIIYSNVKTVCTKGPLSKESVWILFCQLQHPKGMHHTLRHLGLPRWYENRRHTEPFIRFLHHFQWRRSTMCRSAAFTWRSMSQWENALSFEYSSTQHWYVSAKATRCRSIHVLNGIS